MIYNLLLSIKTSKRIEHWESGKALLSTLFEDERLTPSRIAASGHLTSRNSIEVGSLEDCEQCWGLPFTIGLSGQTIHSFQHFTWKRQKVARSAGHLKFPFTGTRGNILSGGVFLELKYHPQLRALDLFKTWCELLHADEGLLIPHYGREEPSKEEKRALFETPEREPSFRARSMFASGILCADFRAGPLNSRYSGLTDLGYATYFGNALKQTVEQTALKNAGANVTEIGDGVLVSTPGTLGHAIDDYESYKKQTLALRQAFQSSAFAVP